MPSATLDTLVADTGQLTTEINAMSSHHDYIIEITAQHDALKPFAPENGQPLRFKIGDAVIYTNDAGLQFRRRVTGLYRPAEPSGLYARRALPRAAPMRSASPQRKRPRGPSAVAVEICCGSARLSHALREAGFVVKPVDWKGNRHAPQVPYLRIDL